MERLILKWRVWKIDANIDYGDFKLGGGYSITFDYNDSRPAYINNYGVNILDQLPIEYVDIGKNSSENRDDFLFGVVEYDESRTSDEKIQEITADLKLHFQKYSIEFITIDKAKTFLRDFTNCEERTDGVTSQFTLRQESTDPLGNVIPAYYIIL